MFGDMLYNLVIGPLETVFEIIYVWAYKFTQDPGVAIIFLSLAMNLLLLPLYNRTDAIQAEANETEKRMGPSVAHIKKTFKGNEQYMMLQTYYRQNGYKPTDVLKGIAPLALEIPFFMAAYHFLSHLDILNFCRFGPIKNLARPDGLLLLGGETYNLLPVLMTVINIASSLIYTRKAPLKTKIQLYGMAALFLVLLYDSPAGLAFYWTLNNLFSLIKNILTSLPNRKKTIPAVLSSLSAAVLIYLWAHDQVLKPPYIRLLVGSALALNIPLILLLLRRNRSPREVTVTSKNRASFFTAQLILTLLMGVMIPAALIHSSPEEFIIWSKTVSIHSYVLYCSLIAAGFFLLWMGLCYGLMKPAGKKVMEYTAWSLCGICITDYLFFGRNYGVLSNQLVFDKAIENSSQAAAINLLVLILVAAALSLILRKKPEILRLAGTAAILAMVGMSAVNMYGTQQKVAENLSQADVLTQPESLFKLNKNGKNVVILMLDRAVGGFVPYLFNENPQLQQQFAGFTYYPNTLSFGAHTNVGLPAVFGGYEYTPRELDRRDDELLVTKHNEALRMMPVLFSGQGYDTTVCDPTYADYRWNATTAIYDDYPDIDAHITMGAYMNNSAEDMLSGVGHMRRKFLYYSFFKCAPVMMHSAIYDGGRYRDIQTGSNLGQSDESPVAAEGENIDFARSYSVLKYLPALTEVTEDSQNTFLMMCNDTTHSPQLLQLPGYTPSMKVDNREFEKEIPERTDWNGDTIQLGRGYQIKHYHCNMAAYLQIGRWLDWLRDQGVYDNTRIILASDHGYSVRVKQEMLFGPAFEDDIFFYNPILFIKDFDSNEPFRVDETQMTSADVPTLATGNLLENPVNPFTGNPITSDHRKDGPLYLSLTHIYSTAKNNGTTFLPDPWAMLEGDMWDRNNWKIIDRSQIP